MAVTRLNPDYSVAVPGSVTAANGVAMDFASLHRVGNLVVLSVMTNRTQGTSGEATVFTLPKGFRPAVAWRGPVGHTSTGSTVATGNASEYCVIETNGAVKVNSQAAINLVAAVFVAM